MGSEKRTELMVYSAIHGLHVGFSRWRGSQSSSRRSCEQALGQLCVFGYVELRLFELRGHLYGYEQPLDDAVIIGG